MRSEPYKFKNSTVDLTLVSDTIATKCTGLKINDSMNNKQTGIPRRNYKLENWQLYKVQIEDYI